MKKSITIETEYIFLLSDKAFKVYCLLEEKAFYVSVDYIIEKLGYSRATYFRIKKELKEKGLIK